MRDKAVLRDLGDGLALCRGTRADADAIVEFNANTLGRGQPNFVAWIRDMTNGRHPTLSVEDFTFVEDTRTGKIVSSMNLISQPWTYAGIKLRVGRPEAVSTHPDYRLRGLVRAQFEVIHEWSRQRREHMTAITGIPNFYRQFGYEMAVTHGGQKVVRHSQIPLLRKGGQEPYRVRRASEDDLPFIVRVCRQSQQRYVLACARGRELWRYELVGRCQKSSQRQELRIIEAAAGRRPVGFLVHGRALRGGRLAAMVCELRPGVSWLSVAPGLMRYLGRTGRAYAKRQKEEFGGIAFWLGAEHPIHDVVSERIEIVNKPYAWYVRVPDLPKFLRHVAPVLEQRLAASVLPGHTGETKISFYRGGLRMEFRRGRLVTVEPWSPGIAPGEWGQAAFPGLTFLHLLFGYRTLEELHHAHPDCWARGDGVRALLSALFPKRPSSVWPVS